MNRVIAMDVGYRGDRAIGVGYVFSWDDEVPTKIYTSITDNIEPYVPGRFFLRELPCLMAIIEQLNLNELDVIVIDGYVHLSGGNKGLGAHLYDSIDQKLPIVGIAKRPYHGHKSNVAEVLRGESKVPLYITSVGIDLKEAVERVGLMKGEHRIPTILKSLDSHSKSAQ